MNIDMRIRIYKDSLIEYDWEMCDQGSGIN